MGRAYTSDYWNFLHIKPGASLLKRKHVISKDILIAKYKKIKKPQKLQKKNNHKVNSISFTKSAMLNHIKENNDQSCQDKGNLIFANEFGITKIKLDSSTISKEELISDKKFALCALPDHKYFCINFGEGHSFIADHNFSISQLRKTDIRKSCIVVYLDGLIYSFRKFKTIDIYDLKTNKWRKAANIVTCIKRSNTSCISFERKVIIARYWAGNIRAFDPYSNSLSKILKVKPRTGIVLFVAESKLYCIQTGNWVFESLPKDCFQWHCIGQNSIAPQFYGFPQYSLYNGSIYFVGLLIDVFLFKFNLKTKSITFIDRLNDLK